MPCSIVETERKKEVSNPTPLCEDALCFQGSPGSQPVLLPQGDALQSTDQFLRHDECGGRGELCNVLLRTKAHQEQTPHKW